MSLGWSAMVSDEADSVDAMGDRRVGGLSASMYLLTVSPVNSQLPRHRSNGQPLELGLLHRLPSLPLQECRLSSVMASTCNSVYGTHRQLAALWSFSSSGHVLREFRQFAAERSAEAV